MSKRTAPKPIGYVDPSPEFTAWWRVQTVSAMTAYYDVARAAFAAGMEAAERKEKRNAA